MSEKDRANLEGALDAIRKINEFTKDVPNADEFYKKDFYAMQHPKPSQVYLIIEVADSSLDLDREVKLPLYAAAGVPEYWILNVNAQEIEAHHTPIGNTYKYREIIKPTDRVTFRAFDLVVPAKDIFILPDLED